MRTTGHHTGAHRHFPKSGMVNVTDQISKRWVEVFQEAGG